MSEKRLALSPELESEALQLTLKTAISGHEGAISAVLGHLQPRFLRYFSNRLQSETQDLTQSTLIEVAKALPNFDPVLGRGSPVQNLNRWGTRIAKNVLMRRFRQMYSEPKTNYLTGNETAQGESSQDDLPEFLSVLRERFSDILTLQEFEVVNFRLRGDTNVEIATKLGKSESRVVSLVVHARKKIENQFFIPAGFKRAHRLLVNSSMNRSPLRKGHIKAFKFLGYWYTTDEDYQRYQSRKRVVDQELLKQGYVIAYRHLAETDYTTLKRNTRFSHLIVVSRGITYIRPEHIAELRGRLKELDTRRFNSPGESYERISRFCTSRAELERLRKAARNGKLKAIRKGFWWFTTQEAVNEFLNSQNHQGSRLREKNRYEWA